jgi:uncharacterized protein involved in exopolysaccharide biosynthesis
MVDKNNAVINNEIDLLTIIRTIWRKRKQFSTIVFIFILVGLFFAFFLSKEFTASSTFIPQTGESIKSGNSLNGLASLAGINLGGLGGGSDIPPSLYPKIVTSVPFRKTLLDAKIRISGLPEPVTYRHYYEEIYSPGLISLISKYTIGLPGIILEKIRGKSTSDLTDVNSNLIKISDEEFEHFLRLEEQLNVSYNEKEGFVSLTFKMPEPEMAAEMAKFAEELLHKEIINFKIRNAQEQLKFSESRYLEKKIEFENIQNKLADFRDRNQNLTSASVLNQLQKLEDDYNFAFNIFNELAKQLEQAKLQVSKDTPLISVIQPVTIPVEKSAPRRPLILLIFLTSGLIFAFFWIIFSQVSSNFRNIFR